DVFIDQKCDRHAEVVGELLDEVHRRVGGKLLLHLPDVRLGHVRGRGDGLKRLFAISPQLGDAGSEAHWAPPGLNVSTDHAGAIASTLSNDGGIWLASIGRSYNLTIMGGDEA